MSDLIEPNKIMDWQLNIQFFEFFADIDWPYSDVNYNVSKWNLWVKRIRTGHKEEEAALEKRQEEWERRRNISQNPDSIDDDWNSLGDEYSETCDLTSSMYAALIVSLWAKAEAYLKELIQMCFGALELKETALKAVVEFCNESASQKIDKYKLKGSIKRLKELQDDVPYKFEDIKVFFDEKLNIKLQDFSDYKIVNAIRILNNLFKHKSAMYAPEKNNLNEQIDKSLLIAWEIKDRHEVDYSKLPIQDLVMACANFRKKLLENIKDELTIRTRAKDVKP